jgi:branched-chain amino acid transport system ATP-binding protein
MTAGADTVLATRGLAKAFGGLQVFHGIDFELRRGECHAVIGPNGAGKSTFVALLTGLLAPSAGQILLDGQDITRQPPAQRVAAGLVRTFQINTLFPSLTPRQSLVLALCQRDGLQRPSLRAVATQHAQIDEAGDLLERFGLAGCADAPTGSLAYGQQRLLEVALACALKPRVLLLDEPAAGLTTEQGHALLEQVTTLAAGTTLLFIEHDMGLVFRFAQRVSVLAGGALIAQGSPDAIRSNAAVRAAYLGH